MNLIRGMLLRLVRLQTFVTNARIYQRNNTYTPRGEVASLTLPDNSVEAWSYNANGELTAYTNPLSQVIAYVYDDAGRMTTVDYPSGTDTAISYDNANRTTQMADATGNTTWSYDAASRVTQLATPQGTQTYSYDNAGRRTSMTEPGSAVTNYAYDAFGRLQTITNPFSEVTQFVYDNAGRVSSKQVASNAYETYSYDNRNRVTNIAVKEQSNAIINSEAYTFDAASNVLTHSQNGLATSYGYDNIGQLITESKPNYAATYSYDSNGNRLTRTINGTTEDYAYDGADKLETVKVGGTNIKSFGYDGAGRTTSIVTSAGTTSLTYDFEGRVTGITYPNTSTNSFTYNGLDSRVGAIDSQGTKTFRRDGVGVTAPLLADGLASYTPGISERRNGTTKYLHGGLKNKSAQTISNQTVAGTKSYDAFGNLLTSTGNWSGNSNYGGNFGYQTDPDSGLKLLGHRYYDPTIGRFITRDPAKDGRNWYSYCENNPVSYHDAQGMYRLIIHGSTEGVLGAGIGDWWMMPGKQPGDIELGAGATRAEVLRLLRYAEEFYFYGHGDKNGDLYLQNGERISQDDLKEVARFRARKQIPRMKLAAVYACFSARLADFVNLWLILAEKFEGYPDVTGTDWPPMINPLGGWRNPINKDPGAARVNDNIKKDERSKPRKRAGKLKGGGK